MEVEVKIRLQNSESHQKLKTLLSPFHITTQNQHNFFFDGSSNELSSRRAVLRLRFYQNDDRCVVSLKANAVLENGVSRVEEDEEEMDVKVGRVCVEEPGRLVLMEGECRVLRRVKLEFGVLGYVGLGGFGNVRSVYEWKGLRLEVDETCFGFGTLYEVECESGDPEMAKKLLEEFLVDNGIAYSYSEKSKFAIFRSGKLP